MISVRSLFLYLLGCCLVAVSAMLLASSYAVAAQHPAGRPEFPNWREVTSVEAVFDAHPERIRLLMAAINFNHPGLDKMKWALQKGDTVAACYVLLHYYRTRSPHWLRPEPMVDGEREQSFQLAQMVSNDSMEIQGVRAKVPQHSDGRWEWGYTGPENDQEFGYSLNGHQYLVSLFHAWEATKDETHVRTFDRIIRDWIMHNRVPSEGDSIYIVLKNQGKKLDYRDIGEVRWRTLEAGNRLGVSWPHLFLAFQTSDAFTPAGRLLLLSGIAEHAAYLKEYHKEGHNWTTMEMNGLALVGLTFPEFKDAETWATYALDVMKHEIFRQVYADGVQKELSTKTQWVALRRFESVADYFQQANRHIPENYLQRVEDMYNYLAYAMRPDGHQPLNNDSDREDLRPRVLKAAKKFDRPDWVWIATNGKSGVRPDGLSSIVFPWAGIHVMRNGWDADSHWAFFDTGPFGTGHQHADMLHLSVAAFGHDLLVDGGRYTHENYFSFDPTIWRGYFRSAFSHNVILVDGKGQKAGPLTTDKPLKANRDYLFTEEFDFARGTFSSGFEGVSGKVEHSRAVLYLRDRFWIVVDEIETDKPRQIEVLWHYAPACDVRIDEGIVTSVNDNRANLRIAPVEENRFEVRLVKGQTAPVLQGWYSADYGSKVPNTAAVFSRDIQKSEIFAWVLTPGNTKVPDVTVKLLEKSQDGIRLRIRESGKKAIKVYVPLRDGMPEIK